MFEFGSVFHSKVGFKDCHGCSMLCLFVSMLVLQFVGLVFWVKLLLVSNVHYQSSSFLFCVLCNVHYQVWIVKLIFFKDRLWIDLILNYQSNSIKLCVKMCLSNIFALIIYPMSRFISFYFSLLLLAFICLPLILYIYLCLSSNFQVLLILWLLMSICLRSIFYFMHIFVFL
jgi:hypothetical protein